MSYAGKPSHASIIDDEAIEWLGDLPPTLSIPIASEWEEAEYWQDDRTLSFLGHLVKSWASAGGKRVRMVYEIAKKEDAMDFASEMHAPRGGV